VVLAYEPESGATFTSGVFTEAAGFGRPVVVPAGSWSAEQLAASNGTGGVFERATSESVADALIEALRSLPRLALVAQKLAPQTGKKNSCRRVLELILALEQEAPDMEPRYRLGEQIDFSDAYASRCFMRGGWAATEPWGVWTEGDLAELFLWPDAVPDGPLILRAHVRPFLAGAHDRLSVRVLCCGQEIAEWDFELGASGEECRMAEVPPRQGSDSDLPLEITFAIDAPRSPNELGLSEDTRSLGLGLVKLSISPAEEKSNAVQVCSIGTGARQTSPL
jgi:hypothetical protein